MNRFFWWANRLAIPSVAGLTAGVGGLGLWGAVGALAIGFGNIASEPAYAQDQQKPQGSDQKQKKEPTPKQKDYAKLQDLTSKAAKANANYGSGCEDKDKLAKLKEVADSANKALDKAIDEYLDKYPSDELKAAKEADTGNYPGPDIDREFHEKYLDVKKKERDQVKKALAEGKELTLAAPAECPHFAISSPGPSIKFGVELGVGWSQNGFEDSNFNGTGVVGGGSVQFNYPIGGSGTYAGMDVSLLGSGISGALRDPTASNIRLLLPIDGILGATFMPSGWRWPLSVYAFGGLAIGDVNISAPPFSSTQPMAGWSIGVGGDLQLSPTWSVGVKYRHFDLGNANFTVFPGGTSFITERGDMVTGTLSYRFPMSR
jgi:opacity protein-like surface antigen